MTKQSNNSSDMNEKQNFSEKMLYDLFKIAYKTYQHHELDVTKNNGLGGNFARTLSAYFLKSDSFLESSFLSNKSKPNFAKGLLIIGDYGLGKTTFMRTYHKLFAHAKIETKNGKSTLLTTEIYQKNMGFRFSKCVDLVTKFEGLTSPESKQIFWQDFSVGHHCFDDLGTEEEASNYGKVGNF